MDNFTKEKLSIIKLMEMVNLSTSSYHMKDNGDKITHREKANNCIQKASIILDNSKEEKNMELGNIIGILNSIIRVNSDKGRWMVGALTPQKSMNIKVISKME